MDSNKGKEDNLTKERERERKERGKEEIEIYWSRTMKHASKLCRMAAGRINHHR